MNGSEPQENTLQTLVKIRSAKLAVEASKAEVLSAYRLRIKELNEFETLLYKEIENPEQGRLVPLNEMITDEINEVLLDPLKDL